MRVSTFIFGLLILTAAHPAHAQSLDDVKITLQLNHASMKEALHQIERLSPFKFLASAEDVEHHNDITLAVKNESVANILRTLLKGTNLQYKQVGVNIILKRSTNATTPDTPPAKTRTPAEFTVSGTIRSARTGETILGATVHVEEAPAPTAPGASSATTATNEYGFYSLLLPAGSPTGSPAGSTAGPTTSRTTSRTTSPYRMTITAIGFKTQTLDFTLTSDLVENIQLDEEAKDLQQVTVVAATNSRSLQSPQMGLEKLNIREANKIPVIFGERDILKTIQLLPGIKSAGDGNSGFYVRGGAADQNLILLDEAVVYNPSHLLGFFSTFNSDAIKNIDVYKGGMPAQYGGRLSSVVDVKMNEGNNKDYGVNGGIGIISSRLTVEGPIQQDKSSFLISGRRTYADLFLKLSSDSTINKSQLYFYDLNAKANYSFGDKDRLYLSGYFGRDVLAQSNIAGINWGNTTATLRWNHLFSTRLFSNTSLIYSNYDYKIHDNQDGSDFDIFSQIRDWNLKEDLQWYAGTKNTLTTGLDAIFHTIRPGEITAIGADAGINSIALQRRYSLENAVYATDTWKATDRLSVTYGLRLSAFSVLGKGDYYNFNANGQVIDTLHYRSGQIVKTYVNPEPRIAASYQLNPTTSIKASYVRNTQNLHLISNNTANNPTDKWVANTNVIKPEIADQWAIGYYKNLADNKYELTVETYYKAMQNQIDYRNGANVFTNHPIESELLFGKGRAYGIEFLLKKRVGRLTGWISYTLSKTQLRINGINNNQWYNARQDRTHDIAIVGIYEISKKWNLSADWVFYTGDAVTFPNGKYTVNGDVYFYYTNRNAYRMPDYHRLDFSFTDELKKTKKFSSELVFGVYNAYGRENAYQISFRESPTNPNVTQALETSLFRWVPSISYNFKF